LLLEVPVADHQRPKIHGRWRKACVAHLLESLGTWDTWMDRKQGVLSVELGMSQYISVTEPCWQCMIILISSYMSCWYMICSLDPICG
jgi:hypothetical protein